MRRKKLKFKSRGLIHKLSLVVKSLSSVEVNQIIGEITDKRVIETTKKTLK